MEHAGVPYQSAAHCPMTRANVAPQTGSDIARGRRKYWEAPLACAGGGDVARQFRALSGPAHRTAYADHSQVSLCPSKISHSFSERRTACRSAILLVICGSMNVESHSYKQPVKEQARELLWAHAISALTEKREQSSVVAPCWLDPIWSKAITRLEELGISVDNTAYQTFRRSCASFYGHRKPCDLKIAYLCGPEPENDLQVLQRLGVEMANIWAIEGERKASEKAIQQARESFPNLKIFPGNAESFFELVPERFDIIYLDFTGHFTSNDSRPFKAVHAIMLQQALTQLGIIITNFTTPDDSREQAEFLASYFYPLSMVEKSAMGKDYDKDDEDERLWTWTDGPTAHGLELGDYTDLVQKNIKGAYSAFLTSYVPMFAVEVAPWIRLLNTQSASKLFFSTDEKPASFSTIACGKIQQMRRVRWVMESWNHSFMHSPHF